MNDQPKLPPGWENYEEEDWTVEPKPDPERYIDRTVMKRFEAGDALEPMQNDPPNEPPTITTTATPDDSSGPVTVMEWTELYGKVNPRITSPRTMDRYRTTVNNFDSWLGRPSRPEDLTADNYGRWVNHRRNVDHVAAGSIRGECEKLRALWRWIAQRKGLPFPNTVLPPKVENTPETWVPEEVAKIDTAARKADWWVGRVPANLYFPAFVGIAIETGERHAAIHALCWEDIDLENGSVTYRPETRKGGVKGSRKPITPAVIHDLRFLKDVSPAAPFQAVKRQTLYFAMRKLLIDAGLPTGRNNMFHAFRRYHATQVHLAGGDATAALGHSDPRLVRKSYIDPTQLPTIIPSVRNPAVKPTVKKEDERRRGLLGWLPRLGRGRG